MTISPISLRPALTTDLAEVEGIEHRSFPAPWPHSALRQELTPSPLRMPLVAEIDDEVVGFLMAWRTSDQLHIINLAVAPEHRRRGVASTLLHAAIAEARRGRMVEVTLEVRPGNAQARAMYQSFGFGEAGVRPGYYADTGEDALVLTLSLRAD